MYEITRAIVTRLFKKIIKQYTSPPSNPMDNSLLEQKLQNEDSSTSTPHKYSSYAGCYQLIRKIQDGGQASIYLALKEKHRYALKIYKQGLAEDEAFNNQTKILERLHCKGITPVSQFVSFVAFKEQNSSERIAHLISMPYLENGDLFEWINKNGKFSECVAKYFSKKLISTFRYLASQHVLHRDIKPQNILLDDHFEPLILDFGFSIDSRTKPSNYVGDIRYASPQVVKHLQHTEKSQIYSLGILLFYVISGHYPFAHAKISDPNYRLLFERKQNQFWQRVQNRIHHKFSADFKELFIKLISPKPSERPDFDDILQYAWFSEETSQQEYESYFNRFQINL